MKIKLLAESIFSLVIHGIGTKAQIIDAIAKEIEKHHEPVRDTYKFDDFKTIRKCIEDFSARFTPGNYRDVIESTGNALGALDRIYKAYKSASEKEPLFDMPLIKPTEPRTCETCDQVFDWIKKNTGWSICDPDTGDVDRNGETYRQLFDIVNRKPRSP